jgi:hypothetical protein
MSCFYPSVNVGFVGTCVGGNMVSIGDPGGQKFGGTNRRSRGCAASGVGRRYVLDGRRETCWAREAGMSMTSVC